MRLYVTLPMLSKSFKSLVILFICLAIQASAQTIQPGVSRWRVHAAFGTNRDIADIGSAILVGGANALYKLDKTTRELEIISRVNGLSAVKVQKLAYDPQTQTQIITYDGANIDIIEQDIVYNIPDIANRIIVGDKNINSIKIKDAKAYLACSFGVTVIDLKLKKIVDTYQNIGPNGTNLNVLDIEFWNNTVYLSTAQGIYTATENDNNLSDFNSWNLMRAGLILQIELFNNNLYALVDSTIEHFNGITWTTTTGVPSVATYELRNASNKLLISQKNQLTTIDVSGTITAFPKIVGARASLVTSQGNYYSIIDEQGLLEYTSPGSAIEYISPAGPAGSFALRTAYANGNMWFAGDAINGLGTSGGWGPRFSGNKIYRLSNNTWINYKGSHPRINAAPDLIDVAIHPLTGHAFFASFGTGIIEMNENGVVNAYDSSNSSLRPINSGSATFRPINIGGVAFDNQANLWVANFDAVNPISVRLRDGTWKSFSVPSSVNTTFGFITCDDFGNKWITNTRGEGLIVFNEQNINSTVDDLVKVLNTEKQNGLLPSKHVFCVTNDLKGELWIGTSKGLAIISNPGNVFVPNADFDAKQIVIKAGTIYSNFLDEEPVYCIRVDAANRKWIGTSNGAWLVSPDGYTVLRNFTMNNSPLPSNTIYEIGIDGKTGEVFFTTENGLVSYMGNATEGAEDFSNVNVYPNPVRPEYTGEVAITGLVENAYVKITDISGNLVFETKANGGMATWNGNNYNGKRVSTGVYLIFASDQDGVQTHVTKLLFIR